jgi:hypothetical protein
MILLDYLMIPSLVYVIMAVALGQLMPEVDRAVWIVALLGFTTASTGSASARPARSTPSA